MNIKSQIKCFQYFLTYYFFKNIFLTRKKLLNVGTYITSTSGVIKVGRYV